MHIEQDQRLVDLLFFCPKNEAKAEVTGSVAES